MISNVEEKALSNIVTRGLLESMVTRGLKTADCLVLSHQDEVLTNRIAPVMDGLDSLLLEQPQSHWDFGQSDLVPTISWAIEEAEIHSLYICGHSLANSKTLPVHIANSAPSESIFRSESVPILERVLENQNRLQDAKRLFASQVDQLLEIPAVDETVQNGGLKVHALFFLAQAGAFMSYDANTSEFQPLIPGDGRM